MSAAVLGLSALWAIAAGGFSWYCVNVARQITYVTLSDGRRKERRIPLVFRLLMPFTPTLRVFFEQPAFAAAREQTRRRLVSAGFEGLISPLEHLALRVIVPIVLGAAWILFVLMATAASEVELLVRLRSPLGLIGVLWLMLYPTLWLRQCLASRHREIRRALPFLLDILTLSVEAGMDFMTALHRHVDRAEIDALGEELIRVVREIQLGKPRREALRDMSARVDFIDLRAVINALVQADELGVSIGSILRIQSDQIRQRRFERAERLAHEAPVKLLFPLVLFIFPAVFLILLGPILRQIVDQGF